MDNTLNQHTAAEDATQSEARTNKCLNIQDLFLNVARKEKTVITIFLMNGFQLRGIVRGFDTYVVILETEGKTNMVYKHAISTVSPATPINIFA